MKVVEGNELLRAFRIKEKEIERLYSTKLVSYVTQQAEEPDTKKQETTASGATAPAKNVKQPANGTSGNSGQPAAADNSSQPTAVDNTSEPTAAGNTSQPATAGNTSQPKSVTTGNVNQQTGGKSSEGNAEVTTGSMIDPIIPIARSTRQG